MKKLIHCCNTLTNLYQSSEIRLVNILIFDQWYEWEKKGSKLVSKSQ